MRYIGNNSYIGFYAAGNHFCATQANLFLHCIYYVEAKGKFLFIFK